MMRSFLACLCVEELAGLLPGYHIYTAAAISRQSGSNQGELGVSMYVRVYVEWWYDVTQKVGGKKRETLDERNKE